MREEDITFMKRAIRLAKRAAMLDEVPVGAVLVQNGRVIAEGHNLRECARMATRHAEVVAIEGAGSALGGWRLPHCTLYVTLEPCPMCAGTVINSRIDRVVFGAKDLMAGCFGSVMNFNAYPFNHTCKVSFGVREEECRNILQKFFENKRKINKGE